MKKKKCLIGYEVEISKGRISDVSFSEFQESCGEFRNCFMRVIIEKKSSSLYAPCVNGLNLIACRDTIRVVDYFSVPGNPKPTEDEIKVCPFCRAEIVIKRMRITIEGKVIEERLLIDEDKDEDQILLSDLSVLAYIKEHMVCGLDEMTHSMKIQTKSLKEKLARLERVGYIRSKLRLQIKKTNLFPRFLSFPRLPVQSCIIE